jgi:hypothetical protein
VLVINGPAWLLHRALTGWLRRRPAPAPNPAAPYRDVLFADPWAVEDDYWRMRAE